MNRLRVKDNPYVFLMVWFLVPLLLVLLVNGLKLDEHLSNWVERILR